jgi:hypothetical protein
LIIKYCINLAKNLLIGSFLLISVLTLFSLSGFAETESFSGKVLLSDIICNSRQKQCSETTIREQAFEIARLKAYRKFVSRKFGEYEEIKSFGETWMTIKGRKDSVYYFQVSRDMIGGDVVVATVELSKERLQKSSPNNKVCFSAWGPVLNPENPKSDEEIVIKSIMEKMCRYIRGSSFKFKSKIDKKGNINTSMEENIECYVPLPDEKTILSHNIESGFKMIGCYKVSKERLINLEMQYLINQ